MVHDLNFRDGTVHCLLRESLQQIGSVDLSKIGGGSSSGVVEIVSMSFTATGNGFSAIDTKGNLYVFRLSPISDPGKETKSSVLSNIKIVLSSGGIHTVDQLVTMYEYCVVSGVDSWDLNVCLRPGKAQDSLLNVLIPKWQYT